MKLFAILFCVVICLFLLIVFIAAWVHDKRLERFRGNLHKGQQVKYFKAYYSRTEEYDLYGNGILLIINGNDLVLENEKNERVHIERCNVYPTDY